MILYHGSNCIVEQPRIIEPNRTLDYGSGFYTTCAEKQAYDWVERKIKTSDQVNYVNVYEFEEKALKQLKVLWFDGPTDEWIDLSVLDAMRIVYASDMYKQLEQESTKRWHEGPMSLYQTI